ncbi:MAG TPA: 50S ribosomal protein L4 [Candidatus Magasanikbacteria bacterium]|nr:50S ribosomal protein L4 [Candidatus Magasanikbacteria bacterium]
MAKTILYKESGEQNGEIQLNDAVFGVKPKKSVIHQVYLALMANAREPWAHTKNRGEVRGGGRKPWKQKGTGRARHGSTRSPIWVGGGITFGPRSDRNYKQKINKKMNRLAVKMLFSDKVFDEKFVVLEDLKLTGKTRELSDLRAKLPGTGRNTLVLLPKLEETTKRAVGNLSKLDFMRAVDASVVDLMHHQYVITTKKGIEILENRLAK